MNFLEQLRALLLSEPKTTPMQDVVNCDYNVFLFRGKNCYMTFGCSFMEDCYYSHICTSCKNSVDIVTSTESELCYEGIDLHNCYNCDYSQDCSNSSDLKFCYDCVSCDNCFGCVGLRHKKFHIFNKEYEKDEYKKQIEEFKKLSLKEIYRKLYEIMLETPRIAFHGKGNQNAFGDYVYNSKNCYMAFDIKKCQDCYYIYDEVVSDKDCVDCSHIHFSELCYDCMTVDSSYNCSHSFWLVNCRDCEYCYTCTSCINCFGCTDIKHKQFYILNKPFEKEKYFMKIAEIKKDLAEKNLANENLLYLALKDIE